MNLSGKTGIFSGILLAVGSAWANDPVDTLSEREFLTDIPMVFAASRLPQQVHDAAGAVSVLNRDFIRASGVRTLPELFRLVPGFQVGMSSGGRPVVAYHGLSGQLSQRMQVYLDGRSVYSPYQFGGVDWSMLNVPLDEIERIEIHRGANSVAYGANAFLGVIHIITRAAAQSVGMRIQLTQGDNGIADSHLRWGGGNGNYHWRLAAGRRADQGLQGRTDAYRSEYLDFRGETQYSAEQEISVSGGITRGRFGIGYPDRIADPARSEEISSAYLQARLRRVLDAGNEWQLSASFTRDAGDDRYGLPLLDGGTLAIDGRHRSNRITLEYQQFKELAPRLKSSWWLEYRGEQLESRQYFNTELPQKKDAWRAYAAGEWRPSPAWTVNVGGLVERDSLAPTQFAGRLALNWKPDPIHTLKLGYSSAFRMPSLFEQRADWRITGDGKLIDIRYLSSGTLEPEQIKSADLIYAAVLERYGLTADVRIFREDMKRLITTELSRVSGNTGIANVVAYDLRNNASASTSGIEYEIRWRPWDGALIAFSRYRAHANLDANATLADAIPRRSESYLISQMFRNGWRASASYSRTARLRWLGEATLGGEQELLTLSLARDFSVNGMRVSLSGAAVRPLKREDEFRELQRYSDQAWVSVAIEY